MTLKLFKIVFLGGFSKHRPSGQMLSISRNVRPSVRVSMCPSVCLFTFEVPFNGLFAPSSRSRMSTIFRDSESLGKSNGKKWSQIWTFFVWKLSKIAARKKVFFFAYFAGLFQWSGYITTWGGYIEIWGGYITTWGSYIEIWGGYIEIWGGYIWCGFWGILGPPSYGIGANIRIGREMLCLPYAGFFLSWRIRPQGHFKIFWGSNKSHCCGINWPWPGSLSFDPQKHFKLTLEPHFPHFLFVCFLMSKPLI